MAGKNQHYLQQMMQRGFKRADGSRRNPTVWVYTKNQAPTIKRIEKTGAEDEFNSPVSKRSLKTLDDKITDWEAHRQADVRLWRQLPDESSVDAQKAAELIGLTGFRTRALRQSLEVAINELIAELLEVLKNPEFLSSMIINNEDVNNTIHQQIYKTIGDPWQDTENSGYSLQFKAIIRMLTYSFSDAGSLELSQIMVNLLPEIQGAFDVSNFNLPQSHRTAMEKYLDENYVRDDLLKLDWFIKTNPSQKEWVLPDCAVIELSAQGSYSPFMFAEDEQRIAILLPLGPARVLVGTSVPLQELDLTELTEGAVKCSYEFFVSSQKVPELEKASNQIGGELAKSISGTIEETLHDLQSPLSHSKQDGKSVEYLPPNSIDFLTHQLEISDSDLSIISERVMSYINSAGTLMDLSRIQSIVLCSDMVNAFAEIEDIEPSSVNEDDMRQFVQWVEVGDNVLGYRLYLQIASIQVLCNPEEKSFEFILNLLLQSFYQIHTRSIIIGSGDPTESLMRYTNSDTGSPLRDISVHSACAYLDTLFGARTAGIEIEQVKSFEHRAYKSIKTLYTLPIPDTMCSTTNHRYAEDIVKALTDVMYDVSRFLAISRDVGQYSSDEEIKIPLAQAIATHDLDDWIDRLRVNLQRVHKNFHTDLDPQLIRSVQLDAERLLWGRGMVIIAEDSGSRLLPFDNPDFTYGKFRNEMERYLREMIPTGLESDLRERIAAIDFTIHN